MAHKWSFRGRIDLCRHPDDFPRYPDPLPDPDGCLAKWLDTVQIQPLNGSEWKCLDNWRVGPRTLEDSFWFCFPKGWGVAVINEGRHVFRFFPGDLILIPKGTHHTVHLDCGSKTSLLVIHFHANVLGNINLLDLLGFPWRVPHSTCAPFQRISNELVHEYMVQPSGWQRTMAARILELLTHLTRHHARLFRRPKNKVFHEGLLRLLPFLDLIEKRFADPRLTIADMARTISVSEVHFRKLLHRSTNLSPVAFLQRYRVQHAGVLLRTTPLSVKQIAEQSGFTDLPYFYRVFTQWTAQTPINYRRTREV